MFLHKFLIFSIISLKMFPVKTQDIDIISNLLDNGFTAMQNLKADVLLMRDKIQALMTEKVEIEVYYECLCPDCTFFDTHKLKQTVEKLASYLNLNLIPYGNAKTIDKGNGQYDFICQHGPEECYGNKLHACAIDFLGNMTKAVFFNSCMMEPPRKNKGSDDEAADECGKLLSIDANQIKQCAKGPKGSKLLKDYGDVSKKAGFKYVPYILINGVENDGSHFFKDVCDAFTTPPAACSE